MGKLFARNIATPLLSRTKIFVVVGFLGVIIGCVIVLGFIDDKDVPLTNSIAHGTYINSSPSHLEQFLVHQESMHKPSLIIESPALQVQNKIIVPPIVAYPQADNIANPPVITPNAKSLMFSKPPEPHPINATVTDSPLNALAKIDSSGSVATTTSTSVPTNTILHPQTPYMLNAGSVIPATMINGINSDLPGPVIAQVRDNIYDSVQRKYLLIPQGSKLIGIYDSHIIYGQQRVLIAWNKMIYPNGDSINLQAMPGTDLEGYAGFYDQVDNKYWRIFGSSFVIGVITAGIQYSQNNTNTTTQIGGVVNPSVGQTLSSSLGQQLGQTGLAMANKNLNIQPTLIIRPSYPFNIMITADLILAPYTL